MTRPYDLIIHGGRYFDGIGAPSAIRNIGIRDGHVAIVSSDPLDASACSMGGVLPGISPPVCAQFIAGRNTFATRHKSAFLVSVGYI